MELQRKGHQSVYDKALTIFQERIKKLKVAEQEIEKERIQTNIDYKCEERKIKEDLLNMCRDRKRFAREAKAEKLPSLNREPKQHQGWTVREKQRILRSFRTDRSHEAFPDITCTVSNVPQIMKRSISKESQFHNWLIGFPKIKVTSMKSTFRNARQTKGERESTDNDDNRAIKRHSKVANIVFNVPLTLRDTQTEAEKKYEVTSHREGKHAVVMATSQNWIHGRRFRNLKGALKKD